MHTHEVLVAAFGLAAVLITQTAMFLMSYLSHRKIGEINDAVNHRHDKDGGGLKLYDLVVENHNKTKQIIEWNQKQDSQISAIETNINDLPCKVKDLGK